ncbi:MAG: spore cortex biosynthesis protein YabQ [Oscillospiraceae bacterium]|nr:spore cortex biosynthesis protein YabQ [Oscillospiraceae bacterium]
MTVPALAAYRFLCSIALGALLGLIYGFLRPPRRRCPGLLDGLFLLAAGWVWLYLSFGICGGDLRLGGSAGLFLGAMAWEWSAGKLLRPVFEEFWKIIARILVLLAVPTKKILKFAKKILASGKKWVTIECTKFRSIRAVPGGEPHGRKNQALSQGKGHPAAQSHGAEDRGDIAYSVFYGGADRPSLGDEQHPPGNRKSAGRGRSRRAGKQRPAGKNRRAG